MRIDVIVESHRSPEDFLRLGRLAEENGLGGVWVANNANGRDPFVYSVLNHPAFQLEYRNRVREIRDLLFNDEQVGALIDEVGWF